MRTADTREEILHQIVTRGGATVAELSGELQLADATVRRHLDRLEADSLLDARPVRQGLGRPSLVYRATETGVRYDRDRSPELAARLVAELEREQITLEHVSEGLAEQLAADHRAEVEADSLEERVAGTVDALRPEGILDEWERTPEGFRLHNNACPYPSAASANDCVCEADRRAIEKLIGAEVSQVGSLAHGDAGCEYVIAADQITPSKRS